MDKLIKENLRTVSIATPSFNQAQFLEETMLSVLRQEVGPIEYIVMDGGSTDGSVEVIRKHESKLAYWQSAKDDGQSAAINAGFAKSSGAIMGWVNSDDYYLPGALELARSLLDPAKAQILIGNCKTIHENSTRISLSDVPGKHRNNNIEFYDYIIQPSTFWTRKTWEQVGPLNEKLRYTFDWDWFIRANRAGAEFITTDEILSVYRIHAAHKSSTADSRRTEELALIYERFHGNQVAGQFRECLKRKKTLQRFQKRLKGWHLASYEPTLMRLFFPSCFRGRSDVELRGFLAMI
ncbi:MAG: glycosyltransferase family 2 protein [Verrucomicrobiales bacterium]